MFNLRPLVRSLPHKSVTTLANGQTNSRPKFSPGGLTQQSAVASILNSFSLRSYAAFSEPISYATPPSPFPRSEETDSPLELLSERQFLQLKEDLFKRALQPSSDDSNFSVPFENTPRGRACLDALVSGFYANRCLEEAESVVRLAMRVFAVKPSSETLWLLLSMHVERGDWSGFSSWFKSAADCQSLSSQQNWDDIVQNSFEADVPPYERSLFVFQTLTIFKVPLDSITLQLAIEASRFQPDMGLIYLQALSMAKDPVPDLTKDLLQTVLQERGWDGVIKVLKEVHSHQLPRKIDALYWAGTLANDFSTFLVLVKFLQNCEVGESFQSRFVDLWLERHRFARNDLKIFSLDLGYFHLLLKKLVRQKANPDCAIEVLLDMKRLGVRGHEEIRTVVDILLLNLGLSRTIPKERKAELKARIDELLPHVTSGAAGESMRTNIEAQDANHRILQSQDPWHCATELRSMLDNSLRPSSVAITHTLARFLHSKHYAEGLSVFRQMLPSLKEIAKETGWMSACGPVYNFAIRLCCRRILSKDAHDLIRELESNHGFLDAFASAELIILAQKSSGHAEAIRVGTERLEALRQRRLKVPPYFYNVLLNTMAEGGHLDAMWQLMDELTSTQFVPTAVTYGTLVKAALKGHDYPRARQLCSQAIQAKVHQEGPAMPIFSQIIEYNLEHRRNPEEIAELLSEVKALGLPTNPRFDLLRLRSLTDLKPSRPDLVLPTLQEMESHYRVPASHYQVATNNLLRILAYPEALDVIAKMRTRGILPDEGVYTTLLYGLSKADGPSSREAMERTRSMFQRDYPQPRK